MMRSDLEAVLFDWGDTLIYFPGYTTSLTRHTECLETLYRELAADDRRECFTRASIDWSRFVTAYEGVCGEQFAFTRQTHREHRLQDRFARTLRRVGCACPLDEVETEHMAVRFTEILLSRARLIDGAHEVLGSLTEQYRLGLVANYPLARTVLESLDRFGLSRYFSTVVISGALGWVKPDPRPFMRALGDIGARPQCALFAGDSLTDDMTGAKALGLWTAWLAPCAEGRPEPVVDYHLRRLPDLLGVIRAHRPPPGPDRSE